MEISNALLQGQRGRRLLWEFAVASEAELIPEQNPHPLFEGMFYASYQLEKARGDSVVMFGLGADDGHMTSVSVDEIAELLELTRLIPVTEQLLISSLNISVNAARYWQEPDGIDTLLDSATLRPQLSRIAEHLAASGQLEPWFGPLDRKAQYRVKFEMPEAEDNTRPVPRTGLESLLAWKEHLIVTEAHSAKSSRKSVIGSIGGEWWSAPSLFLDPTCGQFTNGQPVGLSSVEDGFGWERASTILVDIPNSARVLEISSAEQWVNLCHDYCIEVTEQKRHDWYHVTGRDGAWVIPDWLAVSRKYDAVHLSIGAYLALAGQCLAVDDTCATLIAGWDPDTTYWFIDTLRETEHSQYWNCLDVNSEDEHWVRAEKSAS